MGEKWEKWRWIGDGLIKIFFNPYFIFKYWKKTSIFAHLEGNDPWLMLYLTLFDMSFIATWVSTKITILKIYMKHDVLIFFIKHLLLQKDFLLNKPNFYLVSLQEKKKSTFLIQGYKISLIFFCFFLRGILDIWQKFKLFYKFTTKKHVQRDYHSIFINICSIRWFPFACVWFKFWLQKSGWNTAAVCLESWGNRI